MHAESRKTRTIRAKAARTHRAYIKLIDQLIDQDPETFEQVRTGREARAEKGTAAREKGGGRIRTHEYQFCKLTPLAAWLRRPHGS